MESHPLLAAPPPEPAAGVRAARLFALDATLGVEGLPQSGTGQITLLTGLNAAERFGRHFGPWPPVALRPILGEHNLFRALRLLGRRVRFANAYPAGYPEGVPSRQVAAPALAAHMEGILTTGRDELVSGRAVASGILNEGWRRHTGDPSIPRIDATRAGRILGTLASDSDLTFFAHYSTDTAGHRGGMPGAVQALERVDSFLRGLFGALPSRGLVLVASDHGNIEDVRGGHTRNPALGLAAGPADRVAALGEMDSLLDLAPAVLGLLRG